METRRCHPDGGGLYTETLLRQSRNLQLGDPHDHVPGTMHRAPPQHIAPTGHNRGPTTEEMVRNAMSRSHGHDATTRKWTMQPHLTTQSSNHMKHGGDVYSTGLPNALQHDDCTETGPTGVTACKGTGDSHSTPTRNTITSWRWRRPDHRHFNQRDITHLRYECVHIPQFYRDNVMARIVESSRYCINKP